MQAQNKVVKVFFILPLIYTIKVLNKGVISMTINKINNVQQQPSAAVSPRASISSVQNTNNPQKISQQGSGISPLSSRDTYAIGRDGKRYVLQLRIDIASVRAFSSLA